MSWAEENGMCDYDGSWEDAYEYDLNQMYRDYLLKILFWKTKDGKEVRVQGMEDSHILNILKLNSFPSWEFILKHELYEVRRYSDDVFKDVVL
jgi:hypothetical protein